MGTEKLDNLSKNELFEEIKGKCKKRSRYNFYGGLIALILVIVALIYFVLNFSDVKDMAAFSIFIAWAFLAGWLVLYNYRFLNNIDAIDAPDQLMHLCQKKLRKDKIFTIINTAIMLAFLLYQFSDRFVRVDIEYVIIMSVIWMVLFALLVVVFINTDYAYRKDKEVIEELEELVEEE